MTEIKDEDLKEFFEEIDDGWHYQSDPIGDMKRAINMLHPKEDKTFISKWMRSFFKKLLED